MQIKLLVDGGDMKPGPAVAQQLGPMGINIGKVISDVNLATSNFKGMKIPVILDIDDKTKEFTIQTSSPPTSELIKKELNLEKGTNDHKKIKVGNASIEDIIKVAKIKHQDMLEKDFKTAVKSVLGTAASVGVLVENSGANELIEKLVSGKFDSEIEQQKTETDPEKRKKLDDYFKLIETEQEAQLEAEKKEEEEKAAEAEKKAEAAGEEKPSEPSEASTEETKEETTEKK